MTSEDRALIAIVLQDAADRAQSLDAGQRRRARELSALMADGANAVLVLDGQQLGTVKGALLGFGRFITERPPNTDEQMELAAYAQTTVDVIERQSLGQ